MHISVKRCVLELWYKSGSFIITFFFLFAAARFIYLKIGFVILIVEMYLLFAFSLGIYKNISNQNRIGVVASLKLKYEELSLFFHFLPILIAIVIIYYLFLSPILFLLFLEDLNVVNSLIGSKWFETATAILSILTSLLFQLAVAYTICFSIEQNKVELVFAKEAIGLVFRWKLFTVISVLYTALLFCWDGQIDQAQGFMLAEYLRYSLIPIAILFYFCRTKIWERINCTFHTQN